MSSMSQFKIIRCISCDLQIGFVTVDTPNNFHAFCPACTNAIILLHNEFSKIKWDNIPDMSFEEFNRPYKTDGAIYSYLNGSGLYHLLHKENDNGK